MTTSEKIKELKEWALRHGFEKSGRSQNIFTKFIKSEVCEDGETRDVFQRIVFKDKVMRFEKNYFVVMESFSGEKIVEKHWLKCFGGYYGKLSINKENDKLSGLTRGF